MRYRNAHFPVSIVLILAGALAALLIVEGGLRLAGEIYRCSRIRQRVDARVGGESAFRVLCLGDSFTFGIGAPPGASYPEQLERLLNRRGGGREYRVYNGGIPGYNSSQISRRIEKNIERYDPHVIVVLTGGGNDINFLAESNYYLFRGGIRGLMIRAHSYLMSLRIMKLVQRVLPRRGTELRTRVDKSAPEPAGHGSQRVPEADGARRSIYRDLIARGNSHLKEGHVEKAIESYRVATALIPEEIEGHHKLGMTAMYYRRENDTALEEFRTVLALDPGNEAVLSELWILQYHRKKTTEAQEALREYLRVAPEAGERYARVFRFGLPSIDDHKLFKRMMRSNLDAIIEKVRKNGAEIVLLSYPGGDFGISREVARENGADFVDITGVLHKALQRSGNRREALYVEDGHCNENGYRLMAEAICPVITAKEKASSLIH